jgi:hypothetical protein
VDLTAIADQTDIKIYDMLGGCLLIKKYRVTDSPIYYHPKDEVYIVVASSKGKSISRKVLFIKSVDQKSKTEQRVLILFIGYRVQK